MKNFSEALEGVYIGNESYREYVFPDGFIVRIDDPYMIHVSKSGGHRVSDAADVAHYIPAGWRHLRWETVEGHLFNF